MRILVISEHRFAASERAGSGKTPRKFPSGSANVVFDLLVRGLTELGHDVVYYLPAGWDTPMPGVTMTEEPVYNVEIAHGLAYRDTGILRSFERRGIPTIHNCHRDPLLIGKDRGEIGENWIFVSGGIAKAFGSNRYVHNGLDPAAYVSRADKKPFLLFMSALEWARPKGLEVALSLAHESGVQLVVAGTGLTPGVIDETDALCRAQGAIYLGDVRGPAKAELFADARAFLFPTQILESFGLCMVEALFSGTPVICSDNGACPEIVTPDVGFVCRTRDDYLHAIAQCDRISANACRKTAVARFGYLEMAKAYAIEYACEIDRLRASRRA